ncbi:MAG: hypothetical protein ACI4EN_03030 [Butyrivibrio sp.]
MKKKLLIIIPAVLIVCTVLVLVLILNGEPKENRTEIVWLCSDCGKVPEKNLNEVNGILEDRGYDFCLKMAYVEDIYEDRFDAKLDNYFNDVLKYLENNDADIIWGGMSKGIFSTTTRMVDEGLFEKLDGYYTDNPEFFNYYHENLWKACRYKDGYYFVPNSIIGFDTSLYVEFNPKYVTSEEVKNFDGTMGSFIEMYMKSDADKFIMPWFFFLDESGYTKCTNIEGLLVSDDTLQVADDDTYNRLFNDMRRLNQLYISKELISDINSREYAECLENKTYFAIISIDYSKNLIPDENEMLYVWGGEHVMELSSMGTGIYSGSRHKEEAFELLRLVMTDSEIANALIYGVEGSDYYVNDGIAYAMDGSKLDVFGMWYDFGCYVTAYNTENDIINRYEEKTRFWKKLDNSPLLGFYFNPGDNRDKLLNLIRINDNYFPKFTSENFDEELELYLQKRDEAGFYELRDMLNEQLKEFQSK